MATAKELEASERAARLAESRRRREVRQYETELRDEQWECLAYGHDWPRLSRRRRGSNGKMPKGFRAVKTAGGWQLVEVCLNNCGKERVSTSLAGGGLRRSYNTDKAKWLIRPVGLEFSRADMYADLVDSFGEDLFRGSQ